MKNKLQQIIDLEHQMMSEKDGTRKKMSEEEFLFLKTKFGIDYPENLKVIAKEIGFGKIMPIMADVIDCLNCITHYKAKVTTDFIKTLLDYGISVSEIEDLEFDIINKTFNNTKIDQIYNIVNQKYNCIDIAVNTFDGDYNCYIVLVLTGENKGNVCYDEWKEVEHKSIQHNFFSFNFITSLEDYIINERKKWLKTNTSYN